MAKRPTATPLAVRVSASRSRTDDYLRAFSAVTNCGTASNKSATKP